MLLRSHRQHPGDSYKRQEASWRRAYAEAYSLRERFPGVEQITTEMTFVDVKGLGNYSAQMRTLSASAKAFFAVPCPRSLCLEGGFDLDAVVAMMTADREVSAAGVLTCAGWIEHSRLQHAHCMLQMGYRIQIVYELPSPRRVARAST